MLDPNDPIHDEHAEAARLQQALVEGMNRAAEQIRKRWDPNHQVRAWEDLTRIEQFALRAALDRLVTRSHRHLLRLVQLRAPK